MTRFAWLFALVSIAASANAQSGSPRPRTNDGVIPGSNPWISGATGAAPMPGQLDPQLMPLARLMSMLSPMQAAEMVGLTLGAAVVLEHLNHESGDDYDGSERRSFLRRHPTDSRGSVRRGLLPHHLFNPRKSR